MHERVGRFPVQQGTVVCNKNKGLKLPWEKHLTNKSKGLLLVAINNNKIHKQESVVQYNFCSEQDTSLGCTAWPVYVTGVDDTTCFLYHIQEGKNAF